MRFIKTQIIKTTVFDQEIKSEESVCNLLNTLCKSCAYIEMEYRDSRTKAIRRSEQVRIKESKNNMISITVFTRQGNLTVKDIKYEDIISINLTSDIPNIELGKETSRFDLIDLS